MRKIIASLDVGSSYIKLIVGEIYRGKLNILACVDNPARGIKNGYVVNPESAIESFKETFHKANELLGLTLNKVVVTVPSFGAECFYTEGSTTITSEDKIVKHADVIRSMQASVYNKVMPNQELISILPTSFVVNDMDKVASPIGMHAEKITVKAIGIVAPQKNVVPTVKCLEKIGIEVVDTVVGPLADYYEFKNNSTADKIGAIINIGASKTEISIINKGILTSTATLDVGGNNVEADLAYVYKLMRKDAMYIKENIALAHKGMAQAEESITVTNKIGDLVKVNQYDATEIAYTRLVEILNLAKKQINLLTKKEISYIIVTGGVTETSDFQILLEEQFNRLAKIGNVNEIGIRNNKFSTGAGLIKYYYSRLKLRNADFSIFNLEELEELSGYHKKINISDNSIVGKIFGYFFDS